MRSMPAWFETQRRRGFLRVVLAVLLLGAHGSSSMSPRATSTGRPIGGASPCPGARTPLPGCRPCGGRRRGRGPRELEDCGVVKTRVLHSRSGLCAVTARDRLGPRPCLRARVTRPQSEPDRDDEGLEVAGRVHPPPLPNADEGGSLAREPPPLQRPRAHSEPSCGDVFVDDEWRRRSSRLRVRIAFAFLVTMAVISATVARKGKDI